MLNSHYPDWHAPDTLEEVLELRSEYGEEATLVAGGSFLGIIMNQKLLSPERLVSLQKVPGLNYTSVENGYLRLGPMTTHRAVERSKDVNGGWSSLAFTFSVVASPRVRNQATVGGVVADADYASDPPSMLCALGARVILTSIRGEREVAMDDFITGHYSTVIEPDEVVTELRVPRPTGTSVYRKFRSRSGEDRPCVSVAAARGDDGLRVFVGAVAERPQYFPEVCAVANGEEMTKELAVEIGSRYAEQIEPISDSRGSDRYRKRIIAVEIRRALEELEVMSGLPRG